jgi:hypothetical protein
MSEPSRRPTTEQARSALSEVNRRRIDRRQDRWVHGATFAGLGILLGVQIALGRLAREQWGQNALSILVFLLLWIGLLAWQSRTARTWPRGVRTITWTGLAVALVVGAGLHMWLNWYGQDHTVGVPLLVAASAAIAAPLLVTGALIAFGGGRR